MRAWFGLARRIVAAVVLGLASPALAAAQAVAPAAQPSPPATRISMADAIRLALAHNHQLASQRLNVDIAHADETTAALKPNPVFTSTNEYFPIFTPAGWSDISTTANFVQALTYTFERGGKREKRTLVAVDTTNVAARTVGDNERQLKFQTGQAFINVLLAKSALALARDDLQNFSNVVEVNRQRMAAGDLAEADFAKISLQKLQFEQDVASGEVGLAQAKAALRLNVGFESLGDSFDVDGDLAYVKYVLSEDELRTLALVSRPDLLAAQTGVKLAEDNVSLAVANRAIDVTGEVEYDHTANSNTMGFGVSVPLPFHDRNQGNIAHSQVAVKQAAETALQARSTVLADVANAFAALQASEKVVALFQSGYLDQARQSLETTRYVYQRGGGSLLDLLDAERTNRTTQLAYRQALAAYMTNVLQINFVVGRQVVQ